MYELEIDFVRNALVLDEDNGARANTRGLAQSYEAYVLFLEVDEWVPLY